MQEENNQKQNTEKIIRTYTSDMARAVKMKEGSVIKIAVAQKEKEGGGIVSIQKENKEKKNYSKILFFIGGLILIGLAIFAYYYLTEKRKEIDKVEIIVTDIETPISYDSKSYLEVSPSTNISDISNFIKSEIEKTEKERSIKSIFIKKVDEVTKEMIQIKTLEFLSIIKTSAPSTLLRSLDEEFMTGIYYPVTKENTESKIKPHIFIIFKTKDYNQTYSSMLSWEKTLLYDMLNIFGLENIDKNILEGKWKDKIVNNKDVRVIYDDEGQGVLYYFFLDKQSFVITDDIETIGEVITRFQLK